MGGQSLLGTVLAGRFRIFQLVGRGSTGNVYKARDLHTDKWVALKLLRGFDRQQSRLQRFWREAEILSALRHPGIAEFVANGQTADRHAYLAMEWLEGETLQKRLERGPLPVAACLTLLARVAATLARIHHAGVLHRDIKPANLFLCDDGFERVVLLDFGAAYREPRTQRTALTESGVLLGTVAYMAPEQLGAERTITAAADIFALGLVADECLVGDPSRILRHAAAAVTRGLQDQVPTLAEACPRVPAALSELIACMLALDPGQRPADGSALVQQLQALGPLEDRPEGPRAATTFTAAGMEKHLLSLVVAAELAPAPAGDSRPTSDSAAGALRTLQGLSDSLLRLGGQPSCLPDGSLLLQVPPRGSAHDQVAQAAHSALLIKSAWPAAEVAVVTGRARMSAQSVPKEVLERAAELLRDARGRGPGTTQHSGLPGSGVWTDALSAALLERRFTITAVEGGGNLLTGETQTAELGRPLLGTYPPCVGREQELALLDVSFEHCCAETQCQSVLVTAPPGTGKTRLRQEFVQRLQRRAHPATVMLGLGVRLASGAPYGLLGDALRRLCCIKTSAEPPAALHQLVTHCIELLGETAGLRAAPFLAKLCGLQEAAEEDNVIVRAAQNDPQVMAEHLFQSLAAFLGALCQRAPVLLILDDMQWSDTLSAQLVGKLLRALREQPFMVVALGRSDVKLRLPLIRDWPGLNEFSLDPLSRQACERLVRFVFDDWITESAVARIVQPSQGNPLLLEELIRASEKKDEDALPDTVLAILQARVRELSAPVRLILGLASIFGERFWRSGLLAIGGAGIAAELDAALIELTNTEFIVSMPYSVQPQDGEYSFRHALLHEAVYGLLGDEQKAQWHGLAAEYLQHAGAPDEELLAEHYVRSREPHRAARHFARAAARFLDGNDLADARAHSESGLACLAQRGTEHAPDRQLRGELLGIQARALGQSFEFAACIQSGDEALQLLQPGCLPWCQVFKELFPAAIGLGRKEAVQALAERFLTVAPEREALVAYVESGRILLSTYCYAGQLAAARATLARMETMVCGRHADDPVLTAWLNVGRQLSVTFLDPDPGAAWVLGKRATVAAALTQNPRWIGLIEGVAAFADLDLGISTGTARLRAAGKLLGDSGFEVIRAPTSAWLAFFLAREGKNTQEAIHAAKDILARYQRSPIYCGLAQMALARAYADSDMLDAASGAAQESLRLLTMSPPLQLGACAQLAQILLAARDPAQARRVVEEALGTLQRMGGAGWQDLAVRLSAIEVQLAQGDAAGSRSRLREALQILSTRAERIADPALRQGYLVNVAENARLLALGELYLRD